MLNLIGFLVALPFVLVALVLFAVFAPFSLLEGAGAIVGLVLAGIVIAAIVGVLGLVGTVLAAIFGLVGTILGGLFALVGPIVLGVIVLALFAALVPLLLPLALLAGVIWLIARAGRRSAPTPPALPHVAA